MAWFRGFPILLVFAALSLAHAQPRQLDWRTFVVPDFGTRILYPAEIFTPIGQAEKGAGQRFERADGRAVLSIYAHQNEGGETPTTYLKHNLRMERSALDYVRVARSFFAISSERSFSTAAATSQPMRGAQFIASTSNIHKRRSAPGMRL
jgi:hypothetical protein